MVDCPKECLYIVFLAYIRMQFQMISSFIQARFGIQFQDSHSLHKVPYIVSIIQFYERLHMLLLKALIGSIQIVRHANSLLRDHEKAFDLDKCVVGICVYKITIFCYAGVSIRLSNAFCRYPTMVFGQIHNYIVYMLWNEVYFHM